MKTLNRLFILFVILVICLPAQAQILIYSKTVKCWGAEDVNNGNWDIYTERSDGFLILDLIVEEGLITGINNALQIDYGKYRNEKWMDYVSHNIDIETIVHDDNIQYVFTESEFEGGDFWVMMLTGESKNYDIGLQQSQEIPRQLKGNILWHNFSNINKISEVEMRVQQNFTKEANGQGMNFSEASDMVQDWLRQRGWVYTDNGEDNTTNTDTKGFESGRLDSPWRSYGDENWYVTPAERYSGDDTNSGRYSARAGNIDDDEFSCLELVAHCGQGQISFYVKVSSEEGCDFLKFYVDGVEKGRWSGEEGWRKVTYSISQGTRTFTWIYSKDSSISEGDDTAYIDNVEFSGS